MDEGIPKDSTSPPEPAPPPVPYPLVKDKTLIGRKRECDFVVYDTKCSKYHARIFREKNDFCIVDLGSQNGTFVNEERISSKLLHHADKIRLGFSVFEFAREGVGDVTIASLTFLKRVKPAPGPEGEVVPDAETGEKKDAEEDPKAPPPVKEGEIPPPPPESGTEPPSPLPEESTVPPPPGPPLPVPPPPPVSGTESKTSTTERLPAEKKREPEKEVGTDTELSWSDHLKGAPPSSSESPALPPVTALIGVAVGILLLAGMILFAEEIRGLLGLGEAEESASPADGMVVPPPPPPATVEDLRAEREALERQIASMKNEEERKALEAKFQALRAELDLKMATLEGNHLALLKELKALRREWAQSMAKLEAALASGAEASKSPSGKGEESLSPEEKLFQDVMDALRKEEGKK
ncbi:MAG: FHA domain-containing protein [Planctomycetota bacterium]|jgi:hypothetical protein